MRDEGLRHVSLLVNGSQGVPPSENVENIECKRSHLRPVLQSNRTGKLVSF